jgi:hypothetical protein
LHSAVAGRRATVVSVAKRSPILGYNHNVRYRGLVFHVQTEDSGVLSPHVFTHIFNGGVILSTRKLVYDSGSSEDVIRSLMQAQHKAALKELRRGIFDDKIEQYLGGDADLLPRDHAPDVLVEDGPAEEIRIEVGFTPLPEFLPRPAIEPAKPTGIAGSSPPLRSIAHPMPRETTGPIAPVVTFRSDGPQGFAHGGEEAPRLLRPHPGVGARSDSGRLASMGAATLPPLPLPPLPSRGGTVPRISAVSAPRPAITPPVVVARDLTEASSGGRRTTVPDSAEIYSPAPASAELPSGEDHPGAYSVRRRDASAEPVPRASRLGTASEATESSRAEALRPSFPEASVPARVSPPRTMTPRPQPSRAPTPIPAPLPRSRATGGVVMSRPAVIVGAPRPTTPPAKGRASTEDERRGFGQGLISEKSLDEVILAYLSEDANEE